MGRVPFLSRLEKWGGILDQSTGYAKKTSIRPSAGFRTDINGLRALAIIPVVAFHAGLMGIPGGFIGVDVFFVISGFLITGMLVREAENSGRVILGSFWAKRLRRLVPALALVVCVTLPFALLTSSPLVWGSLGRDAAASLTYASNILFAVDATDYFADDLSQSPFLHTWSLSVEEQFYVLWPLLVMLALLAARNSKFAIRPLLIVFFSVVIGCSLLLSIVLTEYRQGFAFYLLPARAWEFAGGGLLAILPAAVLTRGRAFSGACAYSGLAMLVGGFLLIHANHPFPGILAAVPGLGTILIIAAGYGLQEKKNLVARLLDSPTLQWIGTRSYSWYLWHWPAIVLVGVYFQSESVWLKIAAALCSLGLAAFTYKMVENKFRTSARLLSSTKLTFGAAGSTVLVVCFLAGMSMAAAASMTSREPYAKFAEARAVVSDQSCGMTATSTSGHSLCVMGDVDAKQSIMLMGDSHAGHWKAALSTAASENGVRLLVRWMSACPAAGLNVLTSKGNRVRGCPEFQAESLSIVKDEQPTAVIVSQSVDYAGSILSPDGLQLSEKEQTQLWRTALEQKISELQGTGATVGFIEDNPGTVFDSLLCQTRVLAAEKDCTTPRQEASSEPLRAIDAEVVAGAGVSAIFSPIDEICGPDRCRVVTPDGVPIYRDRTHLSEQWTKTQIPRLREFIKSLMTSPRPVL